MADSLEGSVKEKRQSALKLALVEFAVVFVSEVGWSLVRKTGQSTNMTAPVTSKAVA